MARDEGDSGKNMEHGNSGHRENRGMVNPQREPHPASHSMLTTGALIGLAALVQPELLVGMVVGAGIVMASGWLPELVTGTVRPLVKTVIKAGYSAATMAREMVSEASESVQDIIAEAHAENEPRQ